MTNVIANESDSRVEKRTVADSDEAKFPLGFDRS
jgi:hypothetical protein